MKRVMALVAMALLAAACGDATGGLAPDVSDEPDPTTSTSTTLTGIEELPDLGPAPSLVGLDGWLQSDVTSLDDLRGKVVVVWFWTFGCYNCKNTLPNLEKLYADHAGEDFEIVGVHSPEFTYEEDPDAIAVAAQDLGVIWPIALDTRRKSFASWQGSPAYWPRTYVLDRSGVIRFDHIGEGAYDQLNHAVAALLG